MLRTITLDEDGCHPIKTLRDAAAAAAAAAATAAGLAAAAVGWEAYSVVCGAAPCLSDAAGVRCWTADALTFTWQSSCSWH